MNQNTHQLRSINPATAELIAITYSTNKEKIAAAVKACRAEFESWSQLPVQKRLESVKLFRFHLAEKRHEIANLISIESGKPIVESLSEILSVQETCAWLEKNLERLLEPRTHKLNQLFFSGKKAYTVHEPLGLVAVISPWNFPFSIPAGSVLTALSTGNTVILKPSPKTPLCGQLLEDLLAQAGFPRDAFKLVQGDKEEAQELLRLEIDRVVFTGSVAGGRAIMKLAAENLHPLTLELGGKHPAIVLDDANLDACSDYLVWGAFNNCGQACASIERLYATEGVYDKLVAVLKSKISKLHIGNPLDKNVEIGPVIDRKHLDRLRLLILNAQKQGATLVYGGRTAEELTQEINFSGSKNGFFLEPALLADLNQNMDIIKEEIFGPVLPLIKVKDEEEALRYANDSDYGLGASIWTKDLEKARALASRIKAGMVWINDCLYSHACPQTPWGGIKYSGFGKSHGEDSVFEFVNSKLVSIASPGKRKWHYPYTSARSNLIDLGMSFLHGKSFKARLLALVRLLSDFVLDHFDKNRL